MPSQRRTLWIIHLGSLGDCLLALPAIRAVRASFVQHRIVFHAQEPAGRLLHSCGEVDQFVPIHGSMLSSLLAGGEAVNPETRAALLSCDIAVAWMNDVHGELAATFARFGVRSVVRSPHRIECEVLHQSDRFLETVKSIVSVPEMSCGLSLPSEIMFKADARLRQLGIIKDEPLLIIHPGSGSLDKCVAPTLLADVVQWYRDRNMTPLIVGGPADNERVRQLQRKCADQILVLSTSDLQLMAGILARADLFIGHDSALTHLAAALSVNTVALFGPTHGDRWAPRGSHVRVVTGAPCHCQGWDAVRSCVERRCLQIPLAQIIEAGAFACPSLL